MNKRKGIDWINNRRTIYNLLKNGGMTREALIKYLEEEFSVTEERSLVFSYDLSRLDLIIKEDGYMVPTEFFHKGMK